MNQETLKNLRIIIPGLLLYALITFYYCTLKHIDFKSITALEYAYALIIAVVLGGVYNILDCRTLLTNYSHKKIDLNIKENLLKLYPNNLTTQQTQKLRSGNILKNIFYKIIDNDASLTKKSNNVYFNGLLWTSTADFVFVSFLGAVCFIASTLIFETLKYTFLYYGLLLISLSLIFTFLHILTCFKHIKLSNEQISYMEIHSLAEIKTLIDNVLY